MGKSFLEHVLAKRSTEPESAWQQGTRSYALIQGSLTDTEIVCLYGVTLDMSDVRRRREHIGQHTVYVPQCVGVGLRRFEGAPNRGIVITDSIEYDEKHLPAVLERSLRTVMKHISTNADERSTLLYHVHPISPDASAAEQVLYEHLGYSPVLATSRQSFLDPVFRLAERFVAKEYDFNPYRDEESDAMDERRNDFE